MDHTTPLSAPQTGAPPGSAQAALRHADTDAELLACWPVMQQLRPRLPGAGDFVARVQRMRADRYRILAAWHGDGSVLALAGYHLMENLIYGRFLYVDDLVTLDTARGGRWGAVLMDAMERIAQEEGCAHLVLDTALSNALAQRFYFRQGLLTQAIRFGRALPLPASHGEAVA